MAARSGERRETPLERADRNLQELLQELRVALPGVQVLFAFLLTIPFAQRFVELTPGQKKLYFAVLLCAALSSALLIAPTIQHRILFRMRDKEHLVTVSNRYAVAGLSVLAVGISGALLLVGDFLFGTVTTLLSTGALVAVFLVVWYVQPLLRRFQLRSRGR